MRNLIAATMLNTLGFAGFYLAMDTMRPLAIVILALGTYLVFSFGRLEGAGNMLAYIINEEKEINENV